MGGYTVCPRTMVDGQPLHLRALAPANRRRLKIAVRARAAAARKSDNHRRRHAIQRIRGMVGVFLTAPSLYEAGQRRRPRTMPHPGSPGTGATGRFLHEGGHRFT